jgi:glycerol kinase
MLKSSRTLLFNINTQAWDEDLLELFNIPANMLPTVCDSAHAFGETQSHLFGSPIPITGILGDQQAATVGQCCFKPGTIKSTYGTGCFMLLNTGEQKVTSQHRLLTTVAYRINQQTTYALEGSIFMAGATVQWLCDILGLIKDAKDTQALAEKIDHTNGVYLVPAFTGLGAPYWDPDARGALVGLTRDSRIEHIARAALEAVCYQTNDLMQAMLTDYNGTIATLRVDGGMASNDWRLQLLSDILHTPVQRPQCLESSALGAAWMAGLGAGLFKSLHDLSQHWSLKENFEPTMSASQRNDLLKGWDQAIARVVQ